MTDTAKHTPTPWEVDICDKRNIRTRKKQLVASCCVAGSFPEANAAFIVKAVNCHYEQFSALRMAYSMLLSIREKSTLRFDSNSNFIIDTIMADAIKSAEGK